MFLHTPARMIPNMFTSMFSAPDQIFHLFVLLFNYFYWPFHIISGIKKQGSYFLSDFLVQLKFT